VNTTEKPTAALIVTGTGYAIAISPDAIQIKQELIEAAALITAVESPEDVQKAQAEMSRLAGVRIAVEKVRLELKRPILDAGAELDGSAKNYIGELETHEKRLSKLVGDFEAERIRKVRVDEAERQRLENERIRKEREAVDQRIEAERLAEDAKQAAFAATTKKEQKAAEALVQKAAVAVEAVKVTEAQASKAGASALELALGMVKAPAPTKGVSLQLDYEITDIHELSKFQNGALVTVTEKRKELLAMVKLVGIQGKIPGITIKEVTSVRS